MLKFLRALSVLTGTIIGVGMFGLPYVTARAGFLIVVFYFFFITAIVVITHLMYGKIALGTTALCRLPGYAEEYLGSNWKKISFFATGLGITGALLAYLIVGGEFLRLFFSPYFGGNTLIYTLLFFAAGVFLIFLGIKSVSQIELALLFVFFAILIIFFVQAAPLISFNRLTTVDFKFFTLPYGVILFALWGSDLIPEIKEMLSNNQNLLRKTIITGILLTALTYLFFILVVFGVSGPDTSKEAISGLALILGSRVVGLGFLFGVIACFTSFIALGLTLKKILWYDFGLSKNLSWLIACFFPLLLFLAGFRQFIDIIGATGAVAIGFEGMLIVFIYRQFLKKKLSRKMNPLFYALPLFLGLGVFFEIFYFVFPR